jgi:zinc transport system substrate-binding protein
MLAVLLILGPGCATVEPEPPGENTVLNVVTTIYPLADIAGKLGGDQVSVTYLLPPGASPHTFEPTVEQARLVSEADLFIFIGAGLDDWAVKLAESAGPGHNLLDLSDHVALLQADPHVHEHEEEHHDHGPNDPHFWLDPIIVRDAITPAITGSLLLLTDDHEAYFSELAESYHQELSLLDEEIERKLASVQNRRFIAFHSAWQYFARRYNLEELAVIALFPGQEPSAGWMAELVELVEEYSVTAIFSETQFPPALAQRIAEESGLNLLELDPLGGPDIESRAGYTDLMRHNLNIFLEGFRE